MSAMTAERKHIPLDTDLPGWLITWDGYAINSADIRMAIWRELNGEYSLGRWDSGRVKPMFTAPTLEACATWWEIERSNMPEPKLSYADIGPVRNSTKAVMDAMHKKHGAKTTEELNDTFGGLKP